MSMIWRALKLAGLGIAGWLIFVAALSAAAGGSLAFAVGLIVAAMLLYWTWTERQNSDSAAETAQQVGDNASDFFGGIVDWFTATVVSVGFVALTVGGQFFDAIDVLVQMVTAAPVTSGTLGIAGLLAFFDWNGTVGLQFQEWIVIFVALTVLGVLGRRALYGEVET